MPDLSAFRLFFAIHRWAEHHNRSIEDIFNRSIEDIFTVQDEVVSTIVGTLVGRVASSSAQLSGRQATQLWVAHD
jgi:adenylate cyclase